MTETVTYRTAMDREIEVTQYQSDVYFQSIQRGGRRVALTAPEVSFDALHVILDEIKRARDEEWDRNIVFTGGEGAGKSTGAAHIATRLGLTDEEKVAFSPSQYLERLEKADYLDVTWLDEGTQGLYTRNAMKKENKKLNQAFAQFRIKKLTNIICIPHKKLLDKDIRNRRIHYWGSVETRGYRRGYVYWYVAGKKSRWRRLDSPDEPRKPVTYNRWNIDVFWEPLFLMRFPKLTENNGFSWERYEKDVKVPALNRFLNKERQEETPSKVVPNLAAMIKWAKEEKGLKAQEIADISGLSKPSIYRYLKKPLPDGSSIKKAIKKAKA